MSTEGLCASQRETGSSRAFESSAEDGGRYGWLVRKWSSLLLNRMLKVVSDP
jgi:hypothetical protein